MGLAKICKIMACMAAVMVLGLLFYILLGLGIGFGVQGLGFGGLV